MKATEEAVRAALESTKLNNSDNAKDSNSEKKSEMFETGTKPKTRSIPILEENHQANENSSESKGGQEDSNPEPEAMEETVMPLSPKIKVALQAMENMGFNNDNDWLSDLLMKYNGDIGKV